MKIIDIKTKLESMEIDISSINLGDFDAIGEVTAKRTRSPNDPNYKKYGFSYKSNYERGILIYYLIRKSNSKSFLEIGFGRGYATMCAAKAFYDAGIVGKITTIDPKFDEKHINLIKNYFPKEWFSYITFIQGPSQQVLPTINEKFDLVYIDGDHSYEATKSDWNLTKDKFEKYILFDDYHLPSKIDAGIQCREAIDEIKEPDHNCDEKEFIALDRLIFHDDRNITGRDYGQVLLTKQGSARDDW